MRRTRLHVKKGEILELAGAGLACYAVADLVGVGFALLLAAVLILLVAETRHEGETWAIPLPRRPHPLVRLEERRQSWQLTRARYRRRYQAWKHDRRMGGTGTTTVLARALDHLAQREHGE
jgi:hypothetical protein